VTKPSHTGAVDTIRVLHIDDEREPLQMTKKLLEMADAGIKVESVSSPVEALEMLREGGFDCVVTDYKMSPMDGIEVARIIRESSDLPIIIYTGHGSEDVAVKAFAVGIDDYVRKELHPLHFEVLANRIRGLVERRWAENLYGDILEGSRDGVIIVEGTNFIYANQAMADLLGVSDPLELIGRDILDWIPKSDRERVKRHSLRRQRGEDAPSVYEYSISTSGGEQRVLETSTSLINLRGRMVSLAFTRDVTEHIRMDDELRESEKRYRRLVNQSPDAILTYDFKGFIQSINPALTQLTGFAEDEIIGKHFSKLGFFRARDLPKYFDVIKQVVQGEMPSSLEFAYVTKTGEPRWALARGWFLEDDDGKRIGFQTVVRDITERKLLEEERLEHFRELEMRVEERTRELLDAERMAAAGSIAAMVGHDLRGPLQSIKNAAYLLDKNLESPEDALRVIKESVDRATMMLQEVRDQTHEEPLAIADVDLGKLLGRAVEEAGIPEDIDASVELDGGVGKASLDVLKMRRVLDNLIRNAVEAMPKGGELRISGAMGEKGLVIEVSDTGEGIRDEVMAGLFKPFHTTKPGGMGLGLAYCKRAVEAHGGSITVETELGAGTTFKVMLPDA